MISSRAEATIRNSGPINPAPSPEGGERARHRAMATYAVEHGSTAAQRIHAIHRAGAVATAAGTKRQLAGPANNGAHTHR